MSRHHRSQGESSRSGPTRQADRTLEWVNGQISTSHGPKRSNSSDPNPFCKLFRASEADARRMVRVKVLTEDPFVTYTSRDVYKTSKEREHLRTGYEYMIADPNLIVTICAVRPDKDNANSSPYRVAGFTILDLPDLEQKSPNYADPSFIEKIAEKMAEYGFSHPAERAEVYKILDLAKKEHFKNLKGDYYHLRCLVIDPTFHNTDVSTKLLEAVYQEAAAYKKPVTAQANHLVLDEYLDYGFTLSQLFNIITPRDKNAGGAGITGYNMIMEAEKVLKEHDRLSKE